MWMGGGGSDDDADGADGNAKWKTVIKRREWCSHEKGGG